MRYICDCMSIPCDTGYTHTVAAIVICHFFIKIIYLLKSRRYPYLKMPNKKKIIASVLYNKIMNKSWYSIVNYRGCFIRKILVVPSGIEVISDSTNFVNHPCQ